MAAAVIAAAVLATAGAGGPIGSENFTVGDLVVSFTATQTIGHLSPTPSLPFTDPHFAFSRSNDLGVISIAVSRDGGKSYAGWRSSPKGGGISVLNDTGSTVLVAADITASLVPDAKAAAAAATTPFRVTRSWERTPLIGDGLSPSSSSALLLRFTIENTGSGPLEIGSFGLPMPFPFSAGSAAGDMASTFVDPAIAGQHGFATVTRLSGKHEVLMITPATASSDGNGHSPASAPPSPSPRPRLEAWRPCPEVRGPSGIGGTMEWLAYTKAHVAAWSNTSAPTGAAGKAWLKPSSATLTAVGTPGSSVELAFAFSVAANVRSKDAALARAGNAVVHGIPGYVLGTDMQTAKLMVQPPHGASLLSAVSDSQSLTVGKVVPGTGTGGKWATVPLQATGDDRVRLMLRFSDGSEQVVNYRTLPPLDAHVDRYGKFQSETAFFDAPDPFQRSPSVMAYDRELKKHVTDDPRNYVVGLSDDTGGGANAGFASKIAYRPTQAEIDQFDRYITQTLAGTALDGAGVPVSLQDLRTYGVRSSMFWSPQKGLNETGMPGYPYIPLDTQGWIWDRARGASVGRAYNYPHQTICYWGLYHSLSNNANLNASRPALWYLDQAAKTILGMQKNAFWYSQQGLMAGTVFKLVLKSLQDEGHELAPAVQAFMWDRAMAGLTIPSGAACPHDSGGACNCTNCTAGGTGPLTCPSNEAKTAGADRTIVFYECDAWVNNPFPFGSEFAWDSTGQEEEYVWGRYFGQAAAPELRAAGAGSKAGDALANLTLAAILAYLPQAPHWAYNGAAWSWGDTGNNGKWTAAERVAGHYRVTLNAIPMRLEWLMNPDDFYLLEPMIGAATMHMTTIDSDGAAAMGLHLNPDNLKLDPYSGDFGVGFFGSTQLAGAYYVNHPEFGSNCYLCDAAVSSASAGSAVVVITPRDAVRRRVFIEPLGLLFDVFAGGLVSAEFDRSKETVALNLADNGKGRKFRIRVEAPSLQRPGRRGVTLLSPAVKPDAAAVYELPLSATHVVFGLKKEHAEAATPLSASNRPILRSLPAQLDLNVPGCAATYPAVLPGTGGVVAFAHMDLCGSPDLAGFEGGVAASSVAECAGLCAAQSTDGWRRLACQAYTFAMPDYSPEEGQGWCWLFAGRGDAVGRCGYISSTCDNRPAPASQWPCCQSGYGCGDPIDPVVSKACQKKKAV